MANSELAHSWDNTCFGSENDDVGGDVSAGCKKKEKKKEKNRSFDPDIHENSVNKTVTDEVCIQ